MIGKPPRRETCYARRLPPPDRLDPDRLVCGSRWDRRGLAFCPWEWPLAGTSQRLRRVRRRPGAGPGLLGCQRGRRIGRQGARSSACAGCGELRRLPALRTTQVATRIARISFSGDARTVCVPSHLARRFHSRSAALPRSRSTSSLTSSHTGSILRGRDVERSPFLGASVNLADGARSGDDRGRPRKFS